MLDFITSIVVDVIGEGEGEFVTEKTYKDILDTLERSVYMSEKDNDLLYDEISELAEAWYNVETKNTEKWEEYNAKANKITEQIEENKKYIKRCEATIEIIEKIAEVREWE